MSGVPSTRAALEAQLQRSAAAYERTNKALKAHQRQHFAIRGPGRKLDKKAMQLLLNKEADARAVAAARKALNELDNPSHEGQDVEATVGAQVQNSLSATQQGMMQVQPVANEDKGGEQLADAGMTTIETGVSELTVSTRVREQTIARTGLHGKRKIPSLFKRGAFQRARAETIAYTNRLRGVTPDKNAQNGMIQPEPKLVNRVSTSVAKGKGTKVRSKGKASIKTKGTVKDAVKDKPSHAVKAFQTDESKGPLAGAKRSRSDAENEAKLPKRPFQPKTPAKPLKNPKPIRPINPKKPSRPRNPLAKKAANDWEDATSPYVPPTPHNVMEPWRSDNLRHSRG